MALHTSKKTVSSREQQLSPKRRSDHGKYIKSIVYGGLDGVVTTFVVVAGATGASLSDGILLIFGIGSLLGDALSMGIGDYASSHSELEYFQAERAHHTMLFEHNPEQEIVNIGSAFKKKGLNEHDAKTVAHIVAKHKKTAVEIMMLNEHGIVELNTSPIKKGLYTFLSFLVFGSIPLLVYLASPALPCMKDHTFFAASLLTGITIFTLGALKVRITQRNWLLSGLQMLVSGGSSATLAYCIGKLLSGLA
jgi:VIT1/CCC1 family predicted Fe2+/Mn2+ transporter